MRTKLLFIAFAMSFVFMLPSQAQTTDSGFPKGELSTAKNHTGKIWLSELNVGDSTFDPSIAMATYDAGAKLDWHGAYRSQGRCNQMRSGSGALARHSTQEWLYVSGSNTNSKGKDHLVGACQR